MSAKTTAAPLARPKISLEVEAAPAKPAPARPSFFNHHLNYSQTLSSVQRKLPALQARFSHVIHAPAVEKTSEILEATLARPSVLLGATWTALIVGTSFYMMARHYGYALSGSELLLSYAVGTIIGLAGEGLWRLVKYR